RATTSGRNPAACAGSSPRGQKNRLSGIGIGLYIGSPRLPRPIESAKGSPSMLLTSIAFCALLAPTAPKTSIATSTANAASSVSIEGHGKLPWFAGTFDEALAKAKAGNQLIFIDFWT